MDNSPWSKGEKMTNYGPEEILDLNTSFERPLSKLSENHKINVIRQMELKKDTHAKPKSIVLPRCVPGCIADRH